MNPNKALWEKGDFTEIAAFMRQSGEVLVESLGITTPMRVLDVGCGDGTTALPLARLGAEVVGIDIAKNLVDAGNKRAAPPPPEGFVSPMTWGVESHIIERFGQAGVSKEKISMLKDTYSFTSPEVGPTEFIDLFRRFYGPTMNAFEAADESGKVEELLSQLVELAKARNEGGDGGTSIPATFMRVTVSP